MVKKVVNHDKQSVVASSERSAIRSFVRRQGRLTRAQRSAIERYGRDYLVESSDFEWSRCFGRETDKFVEIGFGMGETLLQLALNTPQADFVGLDIYEPGIGRLLGKLAERDIRNVRIMVADAAEVFRQGVFEAALSGVYIYFPDPWPKKRHHKRRLIQPDFCRHLSLSLRPSARVHLATDCEDYALQMLHVLGDTAGLRNTAASGAFTPRPETRLLTKFERRGLALGHGVYDLVFERQRTA